jgi:hypothetical protein
MQSILQADSVDNYQNNVWFSINHLMFYVLVFDGQIRWNNVHLYLEITSSVNIYILLDESSFSRPCLLWC